MEIVNVIVTGIAMIASVFSVFLVCSINRKAKKMEDEQWGYITDTGLFTVADFILKMRDKGMPEDELKKLITFWEYEYRHPESKKDEYWEKYEAMYDVVINTLEPKKK